MKPNMSNLSPPLHVYNGEKNLNTKTVCQRRKNECPEPTLFLPETNRLLHCERKLGYKLIIGLVWRHIDTIKTTD
jgi:hypothetical protein